MKDLRKLDRQTFEDKKRASLLLARFPILRGGREMRAILSVFIIVYMY